MSESILISTKKALGLEADYLAFDSDVMMHVNSALSVLAQLGIGPSAGFMITGAAELWADLLGQDPITNMVKTYVFLRVKMLFDPPGTSFVLSAMEKQIEELGWRLNAHRESTQWIDPTPRLPEDDTFGGPIVIDGGVN